MNTSRQRRQIQPPSRTGKSFRRLAARTCIGVCATGCILIALAFLFRSSILNGYVKQRAVLAFAEAHPGYTLKLGELRYTLSANRLVVQSITLSATNLTLETGPLQLTGIHWRRLLFGSNALAGALDSTRFVATNLTVEFPPSHYGIRCTRLSMSVPASELVAEGAELRTLIGDEEFFAAQKFRTTRFHVWVPECRMSGLDFRELLQGKSYRVSLIEFSAPSFDALVNRDKPVDPHEKPPLMVHEALAAIPLPFQIDTLSITNGNATYRERVAKRADPGVLVFAAANLSVTNIANRGDSSAAIQLHAQSELMEAGTLKLQMTIPIVSSDLSVHYSGSLSTMDLTRLDAFLDIAEHTHIKSGIAHDVVFDIDVSAGKATGRVRALYNDLVVAVLDKKDGTENGLENRVASFLVNTLKIEKSNKPDASGTVKEGKVNYTKKPNNAFLQFTWYALRSGLLDAINQ